MSTDEIMQDISILNILYTQLIDVERALENDDTDEKRKIHYEAYVEQKNRYDTQSEKIKNKINGKVR